MSGTTSTPGAAASTAGPASRSHARAPSPARRECAGASSGARLRTSSASITSTGKPACQKTHIHAALCGPAPRIANAQRPAKIACLRVAGPVSKPYMASRCLQGGSFIDYECRRAWLAQGPEPGARRPRVCCECVAERRNVCVSGCTAILRRFVCRWRANDPKSGACRAWRARALRLSFLIERATLGARFGPAEMRCSAGLFFVIVM